MARNNTSYRASCWFAPSPSGCSCSYSQFTCSFCFIIACLSVYSPLGLILISSPCIFMYVYPSIDFAPCWKRKEKKKYQSNKRGTRQSETCICMMHLWGIQDFFLVGRCCLSLWGGGSDGQGDEMMHWTWCDIGYGVLWTESSAGLMSCYYVLHILVHLEWALMFQILHFFF